MTACPYCAEEHDPGAHFCPVTGRPFGNVAERMIGRLPEDVLAAVLARLEVLLFS